MQSLKFLIILVCYYGKKFKMLVKGIKIHEQVEIFAVRIKWKFQHYQDTDISTF
jgi:hypothetical protein